MGKKISYPEHEKMARIKDDAQTIGEFLEFGLPKLGLHLSEFATTRHGGQRECPASKPILAILAEYFDIDQRKIEKEKRAMLGEIRKEGKNV